VKEPSEVSPRVVTIGVYGFDLDAFLSTLEAAGVARVLDIRQRRGVRGAEYSWANATRLQAALTEAGVAYEHHRELAPTTELRQLQYAEDARQGVGKRTRVALAREYRDRYVHEILDHADLGVIADGMPRHGATALLCVERDPAACHRSLVADRLAREHGVAVEHLIP
jgi:uncharacterized protein (DUF488 family)